MELNEYWQIIRRHIWLVIGLTLIAFAASWGLGVSFPTAYQATMRLAIKPQSEQRAGSFYTYDEYYAYVATEFLIDDVIEVIESRAFHDDLAQRLAGKVGPLPDRAVQGKKMHRLLMVNVTAGSPEVAQRVAEAVAEILTEPGSKYFASLSWQNPLVTVVDPPRTAQVGESRKYLDVALRTALGFIAGIGLAFLLDYLDGTITGAEQAERLTRLTVLGEIPRRRRFF
ncbi:MAG: Wzz/FepE/Etk N-terminal domain-containing protein [Dehalococcoidales bacterium]|nr:Wzz/FepE/Etk N-terminal domain-containing protein [Dehalococcoidales bacterium]